MQPTVYALKTLMVTMDRSAMDHDLLRYSLTFAKLTDVERIIFLHVSAKAEDKKPKQQEAIITQMQQTVSSNLQKLGGSALNAKVNYLVTVGEALTEVLQTAKKEQVDLIAVGRKNIAEGSGAFSRKLAMRALCSVMIVPANPSTKIDRIFVPIDFSENSRLALERAVLLLQKANPQAEVSCCHVYELPQGYMASGKSKEEFAQIMRENAERRYQLFLENVPYGNISIQCKFQFDQFHASPKVLANIAQLEHADVVVMGSRGRTNIAAALLGSTTDKFLQHNLSIPTFVVKRKEYNLGLLDALLNI